MKKILIVLSAFTLFFACTKKETVKGLELTGVVEGLKQGKLYIHKISDTTMVTMDSIVIHGDSHFTTNIDISEPEMLYLSVDRGVSKATDNLLPFFAEPGKMEIKTSLKEFYAKAKISGSKNQELWEKYKQTKSIISDEIIKVTSLNLYAQKMKNEKMHDSLDNVYEHLTIRNYLNAVNFAVNNGKHEIAPYIALTEIYDTNLKYLDTIQKTMSPEVAKSKYGKLLADFIKERKATEKK